MCSEEGEKDNWDAMLTDSSNRAFGSQKRRQLPAEKCKKFAKHIK
jgi:hypothetical protein